MNDDYSLFSKRLVSIVIAIASLSIIGTLGYTLIEGWAIRDSFYMTIITLSTVGYGETRDLTSVGRLFTSAFIVICLFTMAYWSATLTSCLVEGELNGRFRERRTRKMISSLKGHVVVCGSGAMAEAMIAYLLRKRHEVVLIDADEARLKQLDSSFRKLLTIVGDPTNELALAKTNIIQAAFVVAVLNSEIDNLLVSITAKGLENDVQVYALSDNHSIANRMRKAGVDHIISPSQICGEQVASAIWQESKHTAMETVAP